LPQVALRGVEIKDKAVKKRVPLASCHFEKPDAKNGLREYIGRMPANELETQRQEPRTRTTMFPDVQFFFLFSQL
jgi:hypothetical protein